MSPVDPNGGNSGAQPAAADPMAALLAAHAGGSGPILKAGTPGVGDTTGVLSASSWPHQDAAVGPLSARDAAREIDGTSGRRHATPVRKSFVRSDDDARVPPLAELLHLGGRGGSVAIRLYLALLWRCSRAPFCTTQPARAWATLLALDEPETRGTRRIATALKALTAANLIQVEYDPKRGGNTVTVLEESGDGLPYSLPSNEWSRARAGATGDEQRRRATYFKINSRLWTEGRLQSFSTPALVMLMILLAERGGDGSAVWFSTEAFPLRYRVSHKTRTTGTKELQRVGLLRVNRQALPDSGSSGQIFARQRYRNIYTLDGTALPPAQNDEDLDPPHESTSKRTNKTTHQAQRSDAAKTPTKLTRKKTSTPKSQPDTDATRRRRTPRRRPS